MPVGSSYRPETRQQAELRKANAQTKAPPIKPHHFALGPSAAGGAALRRGTFQPENRKQQGELAQGVRQNAVEQNRQQRRQAAQAQARSLYKQGKRAEAIKLAQTQGLGISAPGAVGKYIERTGSDLGQAAYYTPGGLVAVGKAGVQAVQGNPRPIERLGKQIASQTAESFVHPGRHPGYTLLNVLAAASAGAGAVSRVGAAGEALRSGEGIGAAVARPGFKGGSLLRKKAPGEINLPGGAQALEYDNPLLRPVQRARLKRVTRDIATGREPAVGARHLGAQNVVGRELRAREQVQADIAQAPIEAMKARVKKLTPEERTAMRVIATEGKHALAHPEETIARQAAVHRGYAEQGTEPKLNAEIAKDLEKALPVLKERRPEFMQAVAAARRVSRRSEAELVGGERLTQEAADARRAKIAEAYGHPAEGAPKGSFYFPTGERFKFPTKGVRGGAVSRRPSPYGLGPVDASRYLQGTTKQFTGKGLRRGVVQRPGEAIASRATGTGKLASAERVHARLLKLATPEPRSEFDIPIRSSRQVSSADRRRVAAALEEAQTGDKTALVRAQNTVRDALRPGEGDKAVYVDSRYLKEIAGGTGSILARGGAKFNKPFRALGVYFRPAYIATNRPQNFLMRKLGQGLRTQKPVRGTVGTVRKHLGEELSAKIDAAGGQTRTESYVPRGLAGRVERGATQRISDLTDRDERFLAVLARAHQKGYRSEEDLRRLFADQAPQKVKNDMIAISRRADKDMVSFRSVTPGEHELADLVYFYPWLSRGSAWAGRFVAQHPVKSAVLASTAPAGQADQRRALGPIPGWLKGFIPTGRGVINPASVNTFETPAQIGQTFAHPSGPQTRSFGEEFGTPILQALTTQPNQLPKRLLEQGTAPGLLLQRLGLVGKPPKTFPQTGIGPALGPFTFGGLYPRKVDVAEVHKQAYKELLPSQGFDAKAKDVREQLLTAARKIDPKAAPALDAELKLYTRRYGAYKKAGASDQLSRYKVDANLLVQMGKATPEEAKQGIAWAETASKDEIAKQRAAIGRSYFDTGTLNYAVKKLGLSLPR